MNSKKTIPVRERSIVLIGFMGVGKTTIGQLVAKKLNRDFIDVDQEIEKAFHMTIPELFQEKGEAFFRQTEKDMIVDICEQTKDKVISLGGGAFQQEEIRKIALKTCIVLFLDLSWENWKQRMELLIENRPLINNRSIEEIEQLFIKRKRIYSEHHVKVETDSLSPEEAADYIVETLKLGGNVSLSDR